MEKIKNNKKVLGLTKVRRSLPSSPDIPVGTSEASGTHERTANRFGANIQVTTMRLATAVFCFE